MNLVQLVLVIVIVGVSVGAFALPVVSGVDLWEFIQTRQELLAEAHYGLERMVREMTCVWDDQSETVATANTFAFFPSATNESVTFSFDPAATAPRPLRRNGVSLIGGGAASAVSVTALTFTYYDMSNAVLSYAVVAAAVAKLVARERPNTLPFPVWRIRIDLSAKAPNGQTVTLQEEVFPRAWQLERKGGTVIN